MKKIIFIVGLVLMVSTMAFAQVAEIYPSFDFPTVQSEREASRVFTNTMFEIEQAMRDQNSYFPGVTFTSNIMNSDTGVIFKHYVYEDLGVEVWSVTGFPTNVSPMDNNEPITGVSVRSIGEVSLEDMVRSLTVYFAQNFMLQ